MSHLHSVVGAARLHFYTRVLPWGSGGISALFAILWLWAYTDSRPDRAASFLVVAIFMGILTVVALDVARMLRRLEAASLVKPQP